MNKSTGNNHKQKKKCPDNPIKCNFDNSLLIDSLTDSSSPRLVVPLIQTINVPGEKTDTMWLWILLTFDAKTK